MKPDLVSLLADFAARALSGEDATALDLAPIEAAAKADPSRALNHAALEAAAQIREADPEAFAKLKRAFKAAGVGLTDWQKG